MTIEPGTKTTEQIILWFPNVEYPCNSREEAITLGRNMIENGSIDRYKIYTQIVTTTIVEVLFVE